MIIHIVDGYYLLEQCNIYILETNGKVNSLITTGCEEESSSNESFNGTNARIMWASILNNWSLNFLFIFCLSSSFDFFILASRHPRFHWFSPALLSIWRSISLNVGMTTTRRIQEMCSMWMWMKSNNARKSTLIKLLENVYFNDWNNEICQFSIELNFDFMFDFAASIWKVEISIKMRSFELKYFCEWNKTTTKSFPAFNLICSRTFLLCTSHIEILNVPGERKIISKYQLI